MRGAASWKALARRTSATGKPPTPFERMAFTEFDQKTLTGHGDAERLTGTSVSEGFFEMLGVPPRLGRWFTPQEQKPGADHVVLVSHGFWMRTMGGRPEAVGSTLFLSDPLPHHGRYAGEFSFQHMVCRRILDPDPLRQLWTPEPPVCRLRATEARGRHPGGAGPDERNRPTDGTGVFGLRGLARARRELAQRLPEGVQSGAADLRRRGTDRTAGGHII